MGEMSNDPFEQWLSDELKAGFRRISSRPVPEAPLYRVEGQPRSTPMSVFSRLSAALTTRVAMGLAAAALATTGTAALVAVNASDHKTVSDTPGLVAPTATSETPEATETPSSSSSSSADASIDTETPEPSSTPHATEAEKVEACKTGLAAAVAAGTATDHGIGECVSKDASENGAAHSPATTHGDEHAQGGTKDAGDHGSAESSSKPTH